MVEQFEDLLVRILLLAACISFVSAEGGGLSEERCGACDVLVATYLPAILDALIRALNTLFSTPELGVGC